MLSFVACSTMSGTVIWRKTIQWNWYILNLSFKFNILLFIEKFLTSSSNLISFSMSHFSVADLHNNVKNTLKFKQWKHITIWIFELGQSQIPCRLVIVYLFSLKGRVFLWVLIPTQCVSILSFYPKGGHTHQGPQVTQLHVSFECQFTCLHHVCSTAPCSFFSLQYSYWTCRVILFNFVQ